MSLFYRKDKKRWVFKYLDGDAWRQAVAPKEIQREKAAEEWASGWLASQAASGMAPIRRRAQGPTMREVHERWLKLRREAQEDGRPKFKPATLSDNESHLKTHILPAIGDLPLAELDTVRLRDWVRTLRGKKAPLTVHHVHATATALVEDAMAENWVVLAANPLKHPTVVRELPPAKRRSGPRPVVVEAEHVQRLVSCPEVPVHWRVRYLVSFCAGLSEGELAGRVWADADLGAQPVIEIASALATRGPDGWATMTSTKNEHRVRRVPLHRAAAAALRWWKDEGWAQYVGRPPKSTDPIFPGPKGNFSRPASSKNLRKHLEVAGCPAGAGARRVTAQAARRTFSTMLDAAGVAEEVRGRLMGHAPRTVTAKHYTAAQLERDRAAVELIPLHWEPAMVPSLVPALVPAAPNHAESFEPPSGFEPETYGLRNRCSTTELRWQPR